MIRSIVFAAPDGVQSGKHQMSGLCQCNDGCNCFIVTHLSHQNDIRILPQGSAQGGRIASRVKSYLPLVYQRFAVAVKIFNRILQRNNMVSPCLINPLYQ